MHLQKVTIVTESERCCGTF